MGNKQSSKKIEPQQIDNKSMSIKTEISLGEFLDKITILEIKKSRIKDAKKRANIGREYQMLSEQWNNSDFVNSEIDEERTSLKAINESLWDIEDKIRSKESRGEFDEVFIELARSVYITNDKRVKIKQEINQKLSSAFIEEKSYKEY